MSYILTPRQAYLLDCQAGVPVEIQLGNHEYQDCRTLGICRMYLEGRPPIRKRGCATVSAYIQLEAQTERLLIHFLTATICQKHCRKHFADGTFRMPADYPLTPEILQAIGLTDGSYQLQRGNYPILDMEEFLTISVAVSECEAGYRSVSTVPFTNTIYRRLAA